VHFVGFYDKNKLIFFKRSLPYLWSRLLPSSSDRRLRQQDPAKVWTFLPSPTASFPSHLSQSLKSLKCCVKIDFRSLPSLFLPVIHSLREDILHCVISQFHKSSVQNVLMTCHSFSVKIINFCIACHIAHFLYRGSNVGIYHSHGVFARRGILGQIHCRHYADYNYPVTSPEAKLFSSGLLSTTWIFLS